MIKSPIQRVIRHKKQIIPQYVNGKMRLVIMDIGIPDVDYIWRIGKIKRYESQSR